MPSLTTQIFAHREDGSGVRHPGVVLINLGLAIWLGHTLLMQSGHSLHHKIFLGATFWLYCCSATYHAVRPNQLVRFLDQSAIGWMILSIPMVFVPDATPFLVLFGLLNTANKWYNWEKTDERSCQIFLALGILSAALTLFVGLPNLGSGPFTFDTPALLVWLSIFAFVGKLWIYSRQKFCLVPNVVEPDESGHACLAVGVIAIVTASGYV